MSRKIQRFLCIYLPKWSSERRNDYRQLFKLALWALRFSPRVALDAQILSALKKQEAVISPLASGLIIDLSGTERLHKCEELLINRIDAALRKSGCSARFAASRTIGASWALSRFAPERVSIISSDYPIVDALRSLPLAGLRISSQEVEALREIGLSTIDDLLKLPRRAAAARFGFKLIERIDQLSGAVPEALACINSEKSYAISKRLSAPTWNAAEVQEILKRLFLKLQQQLIDDHKEAEHFIIQLRSDANLRPIIKELSLNTALSDIKKVPQIIEPFISKLQIQRGIEQFTVLAPSPRTANHWQYGLPALETSDSSLTRAEFELLLNQYAARFGADALRCAAFHEDHTPEKSFSYPRLVPQPQPKDAACKHDFPSLILPKPEEIRVIALLPDYAPAVIHWRKKRLRITRSVGPEKVNENWWNDPLKPQLSSRSYFKIQEEQGQWLWLYREEISMRWYVHGVWA